MECLRLRQLAITFMEADGYIDRLNLEDYH